MPDVSNISLKIIMLGDGKVGKTSLRRSYMGESFQQNYLMTIGADFSLKNVTLDNTRLKLHIWDIAGQKIYQMMQPSYFKMAVGAIVVYSRIDRGSVKSLENWIEGYFNHSGFDTRNNSLLILGNKTDLKDASDDFISDEEHKEIVSKIQLKFPESHVFGYLTSALTGENVNEAFTEFGMQCYEWAKNAAKGVKPKPGKYQLNFPFAAIFAMNDHMGPLFITSQPPISKFDKSKVLSSMINLLVTQDSEHIVDQGSTVGQISWTEPSCMLYYVAFVMSNPNARGGKEIYVIGLGVKRDLHESIDRSSLIGFLQSSLNDFARFRFTNKIEFVTKMHNHGLPGADFAELNIMLEHLRKKGQKSIEPIF